MHLSSSLRIGPTFLWKQKLLASEIPEAPAKDGQRHSVRLALRQTTNFLWRAWSPMILIATNGSGKPLAAIGGSNPTSDRHHPCVVNASASRVFCSTSWALADPVAGLALAERFTDNTGRPPAIRRKRGSM